MPHYNLSGIHQGSTFSLLFKARTCAGATIDLTDYSINSSIREKYSATTGVTSFTSAITVPTSGICSISLTAAQTSGLASNIYIYSVNTSNSSTLDSFNLLEGYLLIDPFPAF